MKLPHFKQSALDLCIRGTLGTFSVAHSGEGSVEVRYMETHVTLSHAGGHDEKLLKMLRPVREVFPIRALDFEQIMQRDIDDARVSTELIPYLIGQSRYGLVKFFPPIIVVVLPKGKYELPADHYPRIVSEKREEEGYPYLCLRAGDVGKEVFEIRQFLVDGIPQDHDGGQLWLNSTNSALVIVDGQHRAMALIALYRNMTTWPEKTLAYRPFYERWTRQLISSFDLDGVKLPVVFCVFPELDESTGSQLRLKVHEACRAIFLALNKNAKKVTRARNFLLDDSDLISAFMRQTLTDIKALDERAQESIRIWNVELDTARDKNKLFSPVAVTSVTHLYHLVEALMLGDLPGSKLRVSGVKYGRRTDLSLCMKRLKAHDELPAAKQDAQRFTCDRETTEILQQLFKQHYGSHIVRLLSEFGPYDASNRASYELYTKLRNSSADVAAACLAMLFDGQGMDRIFEEYRNSLKTECEQQLRARGKIDPHLQAVKTRFDGQEAELERCRSDFRRRRFELLVANVDVEILNCLDKQLNELFDNTLSTSAFQRALVLTFFSVIEQFEESLGPMANLSPKRVSTLLGEYLSAVNSFFVPTSENALQRLVSVFQGQWQNDSAGQVTVTPYNGTLRRILVPGSLDPKEWPKFRVILVELWRTEEEGIRSLLESIRKELRSAVLDSFAKREVKSFAHEKAIPESKVTEDERSKIRADCADKLAAGLMLLGASVSKEDLLAADEPIAEDPAEEDSEIRQFDDED